MQYAIAIKNKQIKLLFIIKNHPELICTPFTGHPVKGVFLCVTVTNSNERQSNYTGKENGLEPPADITNLKNFHEHDC